MVFVIFSWHASVLDQHEVDIGMAQGEVGGGKVKTKKQNTQMVEFNKVAMMFHLYPQWANIPLQDLDECMCTDSGSTAV